VTALTLLAIVMVVVIAGTGLIAFQRRARGRAGVPGQRPRAPSSWDEPW
jgi:hypothetical protein